MTADNRTSYDAIATQWLDARTQIGVEELELLDGLTCGLPRGARVLDLGCGTGRPIAEWLVSHGFRVTGVDQSAGMLAEAQRLLPHETWVQSTIEDFDATERFDAALAWDSLFHIPRARIPGILRKVARLLEPGAPFACTLGGSAHPPFEDEMFGARFFYDSPPPESYPTLFPRGGYDLVMQHPLNVADGGRDKGRIALLAIKRRWVLESPRLRFRELQATDLPFLERMLGNAEVMRHYPQPLDSEGVRAWYERNRTRYLRDGHGFWLVERRSDGTPIGQVGLLTQPVPELPGGTGLEVGYLLDRPYWGQGYATEAAETVRRYAFDILEAPSVISLIRPENTPSRAVAERLGQRVVAETQKNGLLHLVYQSERDP